MTCDQWSGYTQDGILNFTCSFLDNNYSKHIRYLAARLFNQSHSADNIRDEVYSILDYYEIPRSKIVMISTDSGPNIVKGINASGFVL